jgi:transaldolase
LPAIQQLISEGINVNVTLLFGLSRYRQVAEATIAGIEARLAQGKLVTQVASVASFFISRIDSLVDPRLQKIIAKGGQQADLASHVLGQVAIASAKLAYQTYKEDFASDRFKRLAAQGVRVQRLLWASTSTKNPSYPDVKYVEALTATRHCHQRSRDSSQPHDFHQSIVELWQSPCLAEGHKKQRLVCAGRTHANRSRYYRLP